MSLQPETFEKLLSLASEVAQRSSLSIYDIEFVGVGGGRTLRVYLDGEKGVTIDDCADFSRGFSLLLDADDLIPGGAYELEVSSPGLERKLRLPWHFKKAVGKRVQVKTERPLTLNIETSSGEKKSLTAKTLLGELIGFSEEDGILEVKKDQQIWRIELENVDRAKLVFEQPSKNKKPNKGK